MVVILKILYVSYYMKLSEITDTIMFSKYSNYYKAVDRHFNVYIFTNCINF